MKACNTCGLVKPLSAYSMERMTYRARCKACAAEAQAARYHAKHNGTPAPFRADPLNVTADAWRGPVDMGVMRWAA